MNRELLCPVCGFEQKSPPWDGNSASFEICSCCGIQFGYEDHAGGDPARRKELYVEWRERWIRNGMKWWSIGNEPPPNWNPSDQLKRLLDISG